jgi:predicted transcriptional regulator
MSEETISLMSMTADVVVSYLSNNAVAAADLPVVITAVYAALSGIKNPTAQDKVQPFTGAVSVRKSLASPEAIISMIDGKPYSTLKRHLKNNGLSPLEYRQHYNLPGDYPMVAPAYSARRSALAKAIGLGRKAAAVVAEPMGQAAPNQLQPVATADAVAKPNGKVKVRRQQANDSVAAVRVNAGEVAQIAKPKRGPKPESLS